MRFRLLVGIVGLMAILLGACAEEKSALAPAEDRLTFLFFYTDGWVPWARMEPVVNGLEEMYSDDVEFRKIDANSEDGRPIFQQFKLQGHPSYVLVNPAGVILWQSLGEQTGELLDESIRSALNK